MFTHILAATDGSPSATRAVGEAIDLARSQGARLTLVTVAQVWPSWAGLAPAAPLDQQMVQQARSHAEEVLRAAAARVPPEVTVDTRLLEGSPAEAILEELRDHDYDLAVLGSRGLGAVSSALLGSVSHHVLNHSSVPTLIVRGGQEEKGASRPASG
jgi:nucleotide-binding universal stress UspA family protein